MQNTLVSIVVPAKNSAANLTNFFSSLMISEYKHFEVVVNDDTKSSDNTPKIIEQFQKEGLEIVYLRKNTSMAQARLYGAQKAKGDILVHLDSDMEIDSDLLAEIVNKISQDGFDALVIPEDSFGTTFWAKCKWLEKKCYEGEAEIESLRALTTESYQNIGGHNPKMVFSEDKDLDIRIREANYKIGRSMSTVRHNEGNLTLRSTLKKKLGYSNTANVFANAHPEQYKWQTNIFNRYVIYMRNFRYLYQHPLLYSGMVFMKTAEFSAGAVGLVKLRWKSIRLSL